MLINLDSKMVTSIRKIIFIYILFSIIFPNERPKVALVLSGGGAKGIAQIPLLSVIDSLKMINLPKEIEL